MPLFCCVGMRGCKPRLRGSCCGRPAYIILRWDARFETAPTGFVLRPAGIYYFALGCAVVNRAYGIRA